jgi:hypothetical protein
MEITAQSAYDRTGKRKYLGTSLFRVGKIKLV